MTTTTPTSAVSAKALLRDVAFALRMARKISAEIKAEHQQVNTPRPAVRLTERGSIATLGA